MKGKVSEANGVTVGAYRDGKKTTSYIEGELLEFRASGLPSSSGAVMRTNDASNTSLMVPTGGTWKSQCGSQLYTVEDKVIAGTSASVYFRPGCTSGAHTVFAPEHSQANGENLEITFVTAGGESALYLSKTSLTPEGKQDPSCHGGPVQTTPAPLGESALYNRLILTHRWGVVMSWGFIFPLGVSLVRYYPSGSRLKLHRYIQSFGLLVEATQFTCVVWAHEVGPQGIGPLPGDAQFGGTAGSSPSTTHKQRGLVVAICVFMQLVLGIARPRPFPNTFKRRFWLYTHRILGDGAIVIAWIQIWESVSLYAVSEHGTWMAMTIVSCLFMISAMVVVPAHYMLVASRAEQLDDLESESMTGSRLSLEATGRQVAAEDEPHPRDAQFFGCGYCNQVFTGKHILEVHIRAFHPGMEYKEIVSPMSQRLAEVINNPATTEGVTLSEVKKHNHRNDCWVVINGKVYDLTNFLKSHPGGANPILSWAGRDASRTWNQIHQKAWLTNNKYTGFECLGPVAPEPPVGYLSESVGSRPDQALQNTKGSVALSIGEASTVAPSASMQATLLSHDTGN
jgi:cytochrome b involved in lipid metabolism